MHIIFINVFSRIYQFHRIIPQIFFFFGKASVQKEGACKRLNEMNITKITYYFSISAWPFLSPAHVHVICSVWRLLLVLHCNFVILLKVIAQQPLKSKWDKRLQAFTICTTVSIVISERFRLTDLRQCSGGLSRAPRGLAG